MSSSEEKPTGVASTGTKPIETYQEVKDSTPAPPAKSAADELSLGRFLQELPYETLFDLSLRTGNAAFKQSALVTSISLFSPSFIEQAMISSFNEGELSRLCRAASLPSSGTVQELAILFIASLPADQMSQQSHLQRYLSALKRPSLIRLARAIGVESMSTQALLESLTRLPESTLNDALSRSLSRPELRDLCMKRGLSAAGSKTDLAGRLTRSPFSGFGILQYERLRGFIKLLHEKTRQELVAACGVRLPRSVNLADDLAIAEALVITPVSIFEEELGRNLYLRDLVDLSRQLGLSSAGKKSEMAGRIVAWLSEEQPRSRSRFRSFEDARAFVHELKLKTFKQWEAFCRGDYTELGQRPRDIPACPHLVYRDVGWTSWGDWLGTGAVASYRKVWRPFEASREFARKLALKGRRQWFAFCRGDLPQLGSRPSDIPTHPDVAYAEQGWFNWNDWLGTRHRSDFRPFEQAREFARGLGLKTVREWESYCRSDLPHLGDKPEDVPSAPWYSYKGQGWKDWGDWLGTGTVASRKRSFRPFDQAREFAQKLELRSSDQWRMYRRGEMPELGPFPDDIPAAPEVVYRDQGWKGYSDFLGTRLRRRFRSFEEARAFVRGLGLTCCREWYSFCRGEYPHLGRRPRDIPADPANVYAKEGWRGFPDFLGKRPKD